MQANHCQQGMVFAINAPPTGDKSFQNFKNNAVGTGTSTVLATATASVTVSYSAPPPPPPATSTASGYNVGQDGQCQCVCNIDVSNGYLHLFTCINGSVPNTLQGINEFGGSLGSVQGI